MPTLVMDILQVVSQLKLLVDALLAQSKTTATTTTTTATATKTTTRTITKTKTTTITTLSAATTVIDRDTLLGTVAATGAKPRAAHYTASHAANPAIGLLSAVLAPMGSAART